MDKIFSVILIGVFAIFWSATSLAQPLNDRELTSKQRAIIPIAAFTAQGDMERLTIAINEGLDAGLTVNESKEVMLQLYAYAGFPRSLNGMNNLIAVLKEREGRGIKDEVGREASPLRTDKTMLELGTANQTYIIGRPASGATYEFSPEIDYFLKVHLFGDIFERDVLDFKTREVATVATLAGLGRAENQLRGHLNCSLNIGITEEQLKDLIRVLNEKVGPAEANVTATILQGILTNR